MPDVPGMSTSRTTQSGFTSEMAVSPSAAFAASCTAKPLVVRAVRTSTRMSSESSTTRTTGMSDAGLHAVSPGSHPSGCHSPVAAARTTASVFDAPPGRPK